MKKPGFVIGETLDMTNLDTGKSEDIEIALILYHKATDTYYYGVLHNTGKPYKDYMLDIASGCDIIDTKDFDMKEKIIFIPESEVGTERSPVNAAIAKIKKEIGI